MKQEHYNKAQKLNRQIDTLKELISNARVEHIYIRIGSSELNAYFYPESFIEIKEKIIEIWDKDLDKKTREFEAL